MTGFGVGEGSVAGGRLRVEIRTVNHRYFNLVLRLPPDLSGLDAEFRERLRRDLDRGHVAVQVRWTEPPERDAALDVNLDRARAVVAKLRELKAALGIAGEIDLELVARQPDIFVTPSSNGQAIPWPELEPVVDQAVQECKSMRRREGQVLATELLHRLDLLEQSAGAISNRAPERVLRERDRLRSAVDELVRGRGLDETRLAQEVAFLADKLDITEELVRFGAHVAACRQALSTDQPAGKRLGFLAQELGREVNTMGSKANDAEIAQWVISMKGELEKFREQLENLE